MPRKMHYCPMFPGCSAQKTGSYIQQVLKYLFSVLTGWLGKRYMLLMNVLKINILAEPRQRQFYMFFIFFIHISVLMTSRRI